MCRNRDNSSSTKLKTSNSPAMEKSGDFRAKSVKAAVAVAVALVFSVSAVLYTFHDSPRPPLFGWSDPPDPDVYMDSLISDQSPTNISHIAFGIGGSTKTLNNRIGYVDLWWKPGLTRGYIFLDRGPGWMTRIRIPYRVSSEWRQFRRTSGSESAVRIARVVVDLFRTGLPNVRWFVMGDDDTVFFPENLVAALGRYDHREMVYVGGNSESVEQDVMHAYGMAFGGGGFAISYPLAVQLAGSMDGCLNRYHYFYGSDQRVWACVGEFGVDLTRESGFHQIDIRGNPFGLLAAHPLAPLISLHHLDDVQPLFPNQTQLASLTTLMKAYRADPSRTLQQCFCYNRNYKWSISVSWGYTIALYPELLTAKELETPLATFKTWRSWSGGPFTFNTRPLSADPCKHPLIFYFNSINQTSSNETLTTYRKFSDGSDEPEKQCDLNYTRADGIEEVLVFAPNMDPQEWTQQRRRQCCEISESSERQQGKIAIQVRRCRHNESVTI